MKRSARSAALVIAALAVLGLPRATPVDGVTSAEPAPTVLAVVVNDAHGEDDLSLAELRRVFLGEQRFWTDGTPIHGVLPPQQPAGLSEAFIQHFLGLSPSEFWRRWKSNVFRGLNNRTPRSLSTVPATLRVVFRSKVPMAVVPFESLPDEASGLRVLAIEGHQPGEAGYPLVMSDGS